MEPENKSLEKENSFWKPSFSGFCSLNFWLNKFTKETSDEAQEFVHFLGTPWGNSHPSSVDLGRFLGWRDVGVKSGALEEKLGKHLHYTPEVEHSP